MKLITFKANCQPIFKQISWRFEYIDSLHCSVLARYDFVVRSLFPQQ